MCLLRPWSFAWTIAVVVLLIGFPAFAESRLTSYAANLPLAEIFPGADRLGPVEGSPPAATAYAGDKPLGYVLVTTDVVSTTGYSGKPIDIAVGVDETGTIVGAKLLKHSEPIVLIGIPEKRITDYIRGYVGYNPLTATQGQRPAVDIVSGATVTVVVIGDTMVRAAVKVVRSRSGTAAPAVHARQLDPNAAGDKDWDDLLGDGSVRRLRLSLDDANKMFADDPRAAERPEQGEPDETFIDLYVALLTAPAIGRSLLGEAGYTHLRQQLGDKGDAVMILGEGRYSFRGSGYVRGGIFDRIELVQGDETIRFHDRDYERLGNVAAEGATDFPEIGLFRIPADVNFDPAQPFRLRLLIQRQVGALDRVFRVAELPYQLPEAYLLPAPAPIAAAAPQVPPPAAAEAGEDEEPLWMRLWRGKLVSVGVLAVALAVLTGIFFFQHWFARRPALYSRVRTAFLLFTLLWLGWYANAQLSVVNVLTLTNSLITGFSWDYFLMDPLLFILWAAVAAALVFWGRGAFCGWLCPFGALQEFVNRIAKTLKIRQIQVPWGLHERLVAIKYVVFLVLFGASVYSLAIAEHLAEVEPFKTAIILKFLRDWPFVAFAVLLLVASLFIERFFCRYLCPLGAGLAIPARLRLFDWLRRWPECGSPCQRCGNECPVQAIHPEGHINPNECIYCLHCQVLYWDDQRCPHMIQKRLRRERADALQTPRAAGTPPAGAATPRTSGGS